MTEIWSRIRNGLSVFVVFSEIVSPIGCCYADANAASANQVSQLPLASKLVKGQIKKDKQSAPVRVNSLVNASPSEAVHTAKELIERRHGTIIALENVITSTLSDPNKKYITTNAVRLLGDFRAAHSVSLLINNLAYKTDKNQIDSSNIFSDETEFPCEDSLVKIGMPSLGPLMEKVVASDDLQINQMSARIIVRILGPRLASSYVVNFMMFHPKDIVRQRLNNLLANVEAIQDQQVIKLKK